ARAARRVVPPPAVADRARGGLHVAGGLTVVTARAPNPVERLGHPLLEAPALGRAALAFGVDLGELVALVAEALELLFQLGHLVQQHALRLVLALTGLLEGRRDDLHVFADGVLA